MSDYRRHTKSEELRKKKEKRRKKERALKRMEREGKGLPATPEEIEEMADGVLTAQESQDAEARGISARDYLRIEFDVEPEHYRNEQTLMAAMSAANSENGEN